jgi:FKBP12-rapamycin complex-associated protein
VDPDRAAELAQVAADPPGPRRRHKTNENDIFNGKFLLFTKKLQLIDVYLPYVEGKGEPGFQETRNERALFVFHRVQHKLTGLSIPRLHYQY